MSTTARARDGLRVAELAAEVGVAPDTIRYYEKAGLIAEPARTASGYRSYSRAEVNRVRFIRDTQRLGLKLREIRDLLAVRDTGTCPCEPAGDLLTRRIRDVDEEIRRLSDLRSQLDQMLTALPGLDCNDQGAVEWCPPAEEAEGGECCG
jgi:DNA-binding transcriptional MerR regulator